MPTDIELFQQGGDLSPYSPSQPLAPRADDWGLEPDYLSTDSYSGGEVTFFGNPVSATEQQLEQLIGELAGGFMQQFSAAGYSQRHIAAAVSWFQSQWDSPPRQEQVRHNYKLPAEYARDNVAISFCNHCAACNAPPAFVYNAISWLEKVAAQLNSQQVTPGAGKPTYSDPADALSDKDFQAVIEANERAQANTMDYLRNHWGRHFQINLKLVNDFYATLPPAQQKHLDQYTTGWIKGTNTKEVILALFNEAMGVVPSNPNAINAEIAALEKIMREERKRWNNDESLGARYRQLLDLRGGR